MGETNITRTSPIRNLRVGDGDGDLRGSGASSIIQPWALTPAQSYAARALSESGATHGTESIGELVEQNQIQTWREFLTI